MDGWIVIPNWDKFQHYKRRNPPWIRVYVDLLDHPEFQRLTETQKGLLFSIWLLYAKQNGEVPASPAYLAQHLGGITEWAYRKWRESGERTLSECREHAESVVRARDVKALVRRGFLTVSASKPVHQRQRHIHKELVAKRKTEDPIPGPALPRDKPRIPYSAPARPAVPGVNGPASDTEAYVRGLVNNGVITEAYELNDFELDDHVRNELQARLH